MVVSLNHFLIALYSPVCQTRRACTYRLPAERALFVPGKHPALIVIQEFWGLNDWIREQADRFAKQGYVALAPDLYRGKSTTDPNVAHELMRGLPEDRAMADQRGVRLPCQPK